MRQRFFEGRLSDADGLGGDRHAAAVERPHGDAESAAGVAEHRLRGDVHGVEVEIPASETAYAERIGGGRRVHARGVGGHQERRDAAAPDARLGRREQDENAGGGPVGHPDLAPGQAVACAVGDGPGELVGGIGAGVGFREGEGADGGAARQGPEPCLALGRRSEAGDDLGDEGVVDRQDRGQGGAGRGDRLDRRGIADVVAAGAPRRHGDGDPHQPLLAGPADEIGGKAVGGVDLGRARPHFHFREPLHRRAKGFLFGGQLEAHGEFTVQSVRGAGARGRNPRVHSEAP